MSHKHLFQIPPFIDSSLVGGGLAACLPACLPADWAMDSGWHPAQSTAAACSTRCCVGHRNAVWGRSRDTELGRDRRQDAGEGLQVLKLTVNRDKRIHVSVRGEIRSTEMWNKANYSHMWAEHAWASLSAAADLQTLKEQQSQTLQSCICSRVKRARCRERGWIQPWFQI